jgi:antitoxin ParD1/3/4
MSRIELRLRHQDGSLSVEVRWYSRNKSYQERDMAGVKKLSIALTEELVKDIEAAVASGDYSTASEVVRDALRYWKREREAYIQRLRQLMEEGLASGEPQPMPENWAADVIARGHARPAQRRKTG